MEEIRLWRYRITKDEIDTDIVWRKESFGDSVFWKEDSIFTESALTKDMFYMGWDKMWVYVALNNTQASFLKLKFPDAVLADLPIKND